MGFFILYVIIYRYIIDILYMLRYTSLTGLYRIFGGQIWDPLILKIFDWESVQGVGFMPEIIIGNSES